MNKQLIYRVSLKGVVVGVFNSKKYAQDFIDYQATISKDKFEIEVVKMIDWLMQPRDF
ncbi:hypothetical protein NMD98_14065 [Enterococcus faecium]|uniref:hypothetical protein n=1 Tax=Enterococcus faecium TaxID=1352 RepID=UPI00186A78DB|nr:hypothetical protein [Enterococcus faecium]MBH0959546.1 hypothetical protein [Enterococcus faecium]MCX3921389.1 hypothetical protein [Enterococcus faecium]MCX4024512.1 hypothetical protein [Enterococcus faecium]MDI8369759.1 hypothetical protein [Salmonella enterica subsp. enterica serovar Lubbock]